MAWLSMGFQYDFFGGIYGEGFNMNGAGCGIMTVCRDFQTQFLH